VVTAHLSRTGLSTRDLRRLLTAGLASIAMFLLVSPYLVLDYPSFIKEFAFQFDHYASGHVGMEGNAPLWYAKELWLGTGIAFLVACVEIVFSWRDRRWSSIIVSSFVIGYGLFICLFAVRNERTLLPIVPCILLLAAVFAVRLRTSASFSKLASPGLRSTLLIVLAAALIAIPAMHSIGDGIRRTTPDSRATARAWIDSHLPAHSTVAIESYSPFIDPDRFRVIKHWRAIDVPPQWYADKGVDYVVLSQGMFGRFFARPHVYASEVADYRRLMQSMKLVKKFTDGGYEVLVYQTGVVSR